MLRSPIKKLMAVVLAAAILCTMAMPAAALDAAAPSKEEQAKSYEGATVHSGESDDWTFVPKGEVFASQADDAFTFTSDSDVWVNTEKEEEENRISFADLFDFEPDSVETIAGEDGVSYTVRTYSSAESVQKLNASFAQQEGDPDGEAAQNTCVVAPYASDDLVEVMVVLDDAPVAETAGIHLGGLDTIALRASEKLLASHSQTLAAIEQEVRSFDVTYDYTLLLNGFAGQIRYGELQDLQQIKGVKYAFVAPVFKAPPEEFEVLSLEDLMTAQGVECDDVVPAMENANTDMNTGAAWLQGYAGEGMTVAVIDSGIDLDHVMFSLQPQKTALDAESVAAIMEKTPLHAQQLLPGVTAAQLFTSSKIPFGFDYADADADPDDAMGHGSHVAGILAGCTTTNLIHTYGVTQVGVAPNAQILAMKVFSAAGTASMTAVTAALEDAILLGVDAANLSLGTSCGSVTAYPEITAIFNSALDAGLNVCVAAGNDANSTLKSLWNNDLGLAANPDIGTINMPATFDAPMTVASADNSRYLAGFSSALDSLTFRIGANQYKYAYSDKSPFAYRFGHVLGGGDYSYAILESGLESEYNGIDVTGKLILAKLSDAISINEQSKIAANHGAVGMILYPAAPGSSQFAVPDTTHDEYTIPVVGMAYFYGNNLATTIIPDTVHVNAYWVTRPDGNQISPFSSWGTTNELTLKPEITGIGGSVVSAYRNNAIAISSGTSMASPAVCGIGLLVRQYLKENYDLTGRELATVVDSLLMSSADVLTDASSGLPFSPRAQGAGLVNAGSAIEAQAYLAAEGSEKPKFELGDDPERRGVYSFGFDVVNLSDAEKTYTLHILTLTESATGGRVNPDHTHEYLMEQLAYQLNPKVDAPETVTVGANAKTHVEVTVSLSDADVQYIEKYFENGIYVEGFVTLEHSADGVDLSAPFMGFYGDWTDAPSIESNFFYDWPTADDPANTTLVANTVYTYDENQNETWFLGDTRSGNGQTPYGIQSGSKMMYWDERNAISPNGDGVRDYLEVVTGLLRSVKEYRYLITDANTGEELYRKDMGYIPKAYYSANYDDVVTAGMYSGNEIDFDWTTLENDQKVIVRIEAVADIAGNEKVESWEFPVTCDNQAPVSNIRLYRSGNRYYVQNQIQENRFVDYTSIYAYLDNGENTHYKVSYGGYDPAGRVANVTLGFSDRATEVVSMTMDYAGNANYMYITMSSKEDMVELDAEEVNLMEGDSMRIHQLYRFDTNTPVDCSLTWTTDNADVVSIGEHTTEYADIQAKAAGTATITATNSYGISDSVTVRVVEADDPGYATVTFDPGAFGTLSGRGRMVLPVGHVMEAEEVPEVVANRGYTFKCWSKIPEGYTVNCDMTFTAKYRRSIPTGKTYVETDTIVPGEEYLIVAEYRGQLYAMNNTPHVGGEVALKGTAVEGTTVSGQNAIVQDGLTNCEWQFTTEAAGQVQHVATGRYLSTIYSQGYAWLGTVASSDIQWSWDGKGHLSHNDGGAGTYAYVSYGVSAAGFDAGFDLFEAGDPAYIPIRLYRHTLVEASTYYDVSFVDGLTGEVIETQSVAECADAVLPAAPEHEGYTFTRWDDDGVFITDDLTITAEYEVHTYTVTFVDGVTEEVIGQQLVKYGEAAEAPAYAAHEGYHFTGWSTTFDRISADTTVTALYERNAYMVTFLDWDETLLATETVLHGDPAQAPANPTRAHYTFLCWDTDFSAITADTQIHATYVENDVTTYYAIAIVRSTGGKVEGPTQVLAGEDATFTITPDEDYSLEDVLVDGESVGKVTEYTFEQVHENHYIQAVFHTHAYAAVVTVPTCTEAGFTTYTCACGDTYVADEVPALGHQEARRGVLEATCTEDGYTGDLVCTVCGVVLEQGKLIPAHCPSERFEDLSVGSWYHEATDFVIARGYMCGISETRFAPHGTLTRGQMVTILYRMEGEPQPEGQNPFTDVAEGQYYTHAVCWAAKEGLVLGVDNTHFAPSAPLTREQLVVLMARYAAFRGKNVTSQESLESFPDFQRVSNYAQEPMAWAVETGLICGMDGRLNPRGTATRSQVATIIMKLCQKVLEQ